MKKTKTSILSRSDVKKVAKLANLALSESEIAIFQKQLGEILGYVRRLNKINTENVIPTSQVTDLKNVFREDKEGFSFTPRQAVGAALKTSENYFEIKGISKK